MTRILVISDSHGDRRSLRAVLERHGDADAVFHLGDGAADMDAPAQDFPHLQVYQVGGNCDSRFRLYPEEQETVLGGARFFATHGHLYGVKSSPLRLLYAARERGARVVLFGHTHQPLVHGEEGLCAVNPGSLRDGRYALVDLTSPDGIFAHLERL